jgi:methylmalonyl-CoA carboxyltransferase large subunit
MKKTTDSQISSLLEEIRSQLTSLSERVALLEGASTNKANGVAAAVAAVPQAPAAVQPEAPPAGISEEEILAISAALAACLGVRIHIRQIRLIGSGAWAQEGRVSIQASHRLHS